MIYYSFKMLCFFRVAFIEFSPDLAVKLDRNGYINYAILMYLIDLLLKQCTSYFS